MDLSGTKEGIMNRIMAFNDRSYWDNCLRMSEESLPAIAAKISLADIDMVYLVGCGTSLSNAQVGASLIKEIAGVRAEADHGFSFSKYLNPNLVNPRTLVLGISGGGGTASVERSMLVAQGMGARTVAVTGDAGSRCGVAAEAVLMTDANNEGPTVRTASNLFLQMGLFAFALALGKANGRVDAAKEIYWRGQWEKLVTSVPQVTAQKGQIDALARKYHELNGEMVLVLGAGPSYGMATGGALMVVELGWVDAAAYELEEFTHGRFREMDDRKPFIMAAPSGKSYNKMVNILPACQKAGAPVMILTDQVNEKLEAFGYDIVEMPGGIDEVLTPLLYIFPLWLFGFETGLCRGVDPSVIRYGITALDVNGADD